MYSAAAARQGWSGEAPPRRDSPTRPSAGGAHLVSGDGDNPPPQGDSGDTGDKEGDPADCGCNASDAGGTGLLGLPALLAMVALRRRRQ